MTIYNLGSINIDHVYRLHHLPQPGETLSAESLKLGLGGKGANQSVAAARAGAKVVHLGAISASDDWVIAQLEASDIDTSRIARLPDQPTGHAIIMVDDTAENSIIILAGANHEIPCEMLAEAMATIGPDDLLIMQNETNQQMEAARIARAAGARVLYSAAPFELEALEAVLPYISIIALNSVEAAGLFAAMGEDIPVDGLLITHGAKGAEYRDLKTGKVSRQAAFAVTAVDTTGAGDCFAGWFAAELDRHETLPIALRHASAAAAVQVTGQGAADAMPGRDEVLSFIQSRQ